MDSVQFSSVQLPSRLRLFVTPWTAAHQASLSITNSQSLPKLMSIELVMPSNHFLLCRPLLLLPSIFPSIRVFSHELALCIRWLKYWSFSPLSEYSGLISFRIDWFPLHAVQGTLKNKYVNSRGLRKRKTFPLLSWIPKSLQMVTANYEIKRRLLLGRKAMTNLDSIFKKQRRYFADKTPSSQSYGFSSSHLWM